MAYIEIESKEEENDIIWMYFYVHLDDETMVAPFGTWTNNNNNNNNNARININTSNVHNNARTSEEKEEKKTNADVALLDKNTNEWNDSDYYTIFGLNNTASKSEIKLAYRKKARQIHPNKHPTERVKYQKRFENLQKAYEYLERKSENNLKQRIILIKQKEKKANDSQRQSNRGNAARNSSTTRQQGQSQLNQDQQKAMRDARLARFDK